MNYFISLTPIPDWAKYELINHLEENISDEHDIELPEIHEDMAFNIHRDIPYDLIIKGSQVVLGLIIPLIYFKLKKMQIDCEIKEENGKQTIIVKGSDPNRVVEAKKILDKKTDKKLILP